MRPQFSFFDIIRLSALGYCLCLASLGAAATIHVPADQPTIQAGINAAANGDTVLVAPGTYNEQFSFNGKTIVVCSEMGPTVTTVLGSTIDDENHPTVKIMNGEGATTVLQGFTFKGGPIAVRVNTSATVTRNVMTDQTYQSWAALAVQGPAKIINNTICHGANGGIANYSSQATIKNNIIVHNTTYGIFGGDIPIEGTYNDVYGNSPDYNYGASPGIGSISVDPIFADETNRDYRLLSESPCIDAGDPSSAVPSGGGTRIDMGALEYVLYVPHTLVVPDSFSTIQLAVDNAHEQDTILVRPGTYHENVGISEKNLVLLSEKGADSTFIQSDTSRCLSIRHSTLSISGFRLTGTTIEGQGGAISSDTSTIEIRDSKIENSWVEHDYTEAKGGGIYALATDLEIRNSMISNNNAGARINAAGGGVYCIGGLIIDSCIIVGNRALTGGMEPNGYTGYGGGIYLLGDGFVVKHSTISNNTTYGSGFGGGLYLKGNSFLIDSCIFKANKLYAAHREGDTGGGAGLAVDGLDGTVERCIIDSNMAWTGGNGAMISTGFGGGLYASGSVSIAHNLISNNYLDVSGFYIRPDGIACGGGAYIQGNSSVANNTITSNSAYAHFSAGSEPFTFKALGGGIYTKCTISNNSVAYNWVMTSCEGCYDTSLCFQIREGAGVYIEGAPEAECNVYFGNGGANEWQGNCPASNLNVNPMFCDTAEGDYRIFDLSPCAAENNACSTLIGAFGVGCNGIPSVNEFGVPGEELTNLISHPPVFSWEYFCPVGNPEDSFEIAVGTNPDWSHAEMWNPEPFEGPDTFVTYAGLPLADGATYYLRLRVHNGLAWSEWYNTSFRMNSLPTMPVHQSPAAGVVIATTNPTLWLLNSTDPESDPLVYDYRVYDDSEYVVASADGIAGQTDSTGWMVDATLGENRWYRWCARAYDGYEYSDWTAVTSFYINAGEEFPSPFYVYYPPDTDNAQVYDKPAVFWWGASFDPDPGDSVRYKLLVAIDAGFVFVATYDSIYATQYPVGDLNYSTHYWWKVQAIDIHGNTTASTNTADFWTWILGDANHDRTVNVGDAVFIVTYVFRGGPPPYPLKTGDVNGDCKVNVGDAVYLIGYIFKGGSAPEVGCAK